jgi:steroid delta-isomerase-like uncharacterized protein
MKNSILVVSLVVLLCLGFSYKVQAAQGITEEDAKVLGEKMLKIFNKGDLALIAEVFAPEAVVRNSAFSAEIIGHEAIKNFVESTRVSFPDLNIAVDDSIIQGDKMASLWTLTGTNTGPIGTLPPTGKKVHYTGISVAYVKNGKVVKQIAVNNMLETLTQLGYTLNPPKAAK